MLNKTRGIVLKVTDYSESSVVVQIFTEKFGLQSYLINGVKKPKAKIKMNMLQPLHLVDMIVYHKPNGKIQRISELRNQPVLNSLPYDIVKSSLAIFLNEVLYKSLKQHYDDRPLFDFLFNAIEWLDNSDKGLAIFHLHFLMVLTRYLGFYPDRKSERDAMYFNLRDGVFTNVNPGHTHILQGKDTDYFIEVLQSRFETLSEIKMPAQERRHLLEKILMYYQLHLEGFGELRSVSILEEILN